MKFWILEGVLYASAKPGIGDTWTLITMGYPSPQEWIWQLLTPDEARMAWFDYAAMVARSSL